MSDTTYKVQLEKTLDHISAARAAWEEGTLKASNDELRQEILKSKLVYLSIVTWRSLVTLLSYHRLTWGPVQARRP